MVHKRRKTKKAFRYAGLLLGLFCVFVIALTAVLKTDYARSKMSAAVSDKLGREFAIDGPVNVKWDWHRPYIQAHKIRIANTKGSVSDNMLEIEELNVSVKFWKLFIGRLEMPTLDIRGPHIYLERKDPETNNWDFPALSGAKAAKDVVTPDSRGDMPIIGNIRITEGKLVYKDIPRNIDMTLDIDMAKGKEQKRADIFNFLGKGTLEEKPFEITAESGSLDTLRDSNKDFPLALTISIGTTKFSIDGTFKDPIQLKGLNAMLHLSGGNLADLFYLLHVPLPPTPSYQLDGSLGKDGDKWTFNDFKGRVGQSDLSGSVIYNAEPERPILSGELFSEKLDVADLGGFVGLSDKPAEKKVKTSDSVLPDMAIDLKRLRAGDMDLTLQARQLNAPGWPLSDMNTHIKLDNGLLRFDPLSFGLASGTIKGYLTMDGREEIPKVDMDLKVQKLSLSRFFQKTSFEALSKGYINGRVQLEGAGNSMAKVLGSSDGRVSFMMTGGQISLLLIEATDIDIAQITPLLLGKDKTTRIRCAVGDFAVTDGLLKSNAVIFDTTDTNIKGDAKINLKNESINASLDARPKDPSFLALQSKILLTGKLGKPSIMIDPLTTGLRGAAAALFSVVTPLAVILPFIEVGAGEDTDCGALLAPTPVVKDAVKVKEKKPERQKPPAY